MSRSPHVVAAAGAATLLLTGVLGAPALAVVSPTAEVVVNEVYGGGGNSGAPLSHDFVELRNVTDHAVDLTGWSVQYASAKGTTWSGVIALTGTIPAHGYFLVRGATNSATVGADLPTPDASGQVNLSGTNGNVALVDSTDALTCQTTACPGDPGVVDLVGFGTGAAHAGSAAAPAPSNTTSISRDDSSTNTGDNSTDFTAGTPSPRGTHAQSQPGGGTGPDPVAIADIQGSSDTSPLAGETVTTRGVVTAAYPTGGLNGFVIQTPGPDTTPGRSDAVFVHSRDTAGTPSIGASVQVTGTVTEYYGLTEVSAATDGVEVLSTSLGTVTPVATTWPGTQAGREALESVLIAPSGSFTVTDTYSTDRYGEVGLASGTTPLVQPTDVAAPGSAEAAAVEADNAARGVVLDDGSSTDFLKAANQAMTPPWISLTDPVRVGAAATFHSPVIVDFRNGLWKFNPTSWYPAGSGGAPATFANTRTAAPAAVGGAVSVASFNVLNYFTTLGEDLQGCVPYTDRDGNPVTVRTGCDARGAWDEASLTRQQAKIVAAINALDASVVGLMEIENSARLGETPDEATATLVAALNAAAGAPRWDYVRSSTDLPPLDQQDVITNAIIYQTALVEPVGASRALGSRSGEGEPFVNAREPIAQEFAPTSGTGSLWVVVNHLKSKGSAGPLEGDQDAGDGQGASVASRVAQASALAAWVPTITHPGDAVALLGDFNSYTREDPLAVLHEAGYTDAATAFPVPRSSYSYDGLSGSLDHVLLNAAALARATGADIWAINSGESVALEYSRFNAHGTLLHAPDPYRSSDHDPVKVGFSVTPEVSPGPTPSTPAPSTPGPTPTPTGSTPSALARTGAPGPGLAVAVLLAAGLGGLALRGRASTRP